MALRFSSRAQPVQRVPFEEDKPIQEEVTFITPPSPTPQTLVPSLPPPPLPKAADVPSVIQNETVAQEDEDEDYIRWEDLEQVVSQFDEKLADLKDFCRHRCEAVGANLDSIKATLKSVTSQYEAVLREVQRSPEVQSSKCRMDSVEDQLKKISETLQTTLEQIECRCKQYSDKRLADEISNKSSCPSAMSVATDLVPNDEPPQKQSTGRRWLCLASTMVGVLSSPFVIGIVYGFVESYLYPGSTGNTSALPAFYAPPVQTFT